MTERKPIVFHTKHRAKFHEIDPFGHLNNVHYLGYYNEHRWTGLRERLNLGLQEASKLPFAFYTKHIAINYLRPIFGDEEFEIKSWVDEQTEHECTVKAEIYKNGSVVSNFQMQLVCVDAKTGRKQPWDQIFMNRFYE